MYVRGVSSPVPSSLPLSLPSSLQSRRQHDTSSQTSSRLRLWTRKSLQGPRVLTDVKLLDNCPPSVQSRRCPCSTWSKLRTGSGRGRGSVWSAVKHKMEERQRCKTRPDLSVQTRTGGLKVLVPDSAPWLLLYHIIYLILIYLFNLFLDNSLILSAHLSERRGAV